MIRSKLKLAFAAMTITAGSAAGALAAPAAYAATSMSFTTAGVAGVYSSGTGRYQGNGEEWHYEECKVTGSIKDTKADGHHAGVRFAVKRAGMLGGTVNYYYRRNYNGSGNWKSYTFIVNIDNSAFDDDAGGYVKIAEFIGEGSSVLRRGPNEFACPNPRNV